MLNTTCIIIGNIGTILLQWILVLNNFNNNWNENKLQYTFWLWLSSTLQKKNRHLNRSGAIFNSICIECMHIYLFLYVYLLIWAWITQLLQLCTYTRHQIPSVCVSKLLTNCNDWLFKLLFIHLKKKYPTTEVGWGGWRWRVRWLFCRQSERIKWLCSSVSGQASNIK